MSLELTTDERSRFEEKVYRIPGGCHIWVASTNSLGYGWFRTKDRPELAHRVAWVLAGNEIPEDRPLVLHNCPGGDDPGCVNPEHLWVGTDAENATDMARKRRGTSGPLPWGVRRANGRYRVQIGKKRRTAHIAMFDTVEEAATVASIIRPRLLQSDRITENLVAEFKRLAEAI